MPVLTVLMLLRLLRRDWMLPRSMLMLGRIFVSWIMFGFVEVWVVELQQDVHHV